jgi:DNA-binding transcriptional LysR family regulator
MTAIGQALDSLNDPEKDVQGTLRITVPTVAYSLLLERHIADFLHRYPMLQLEMLIEDALVDIVSAGLDAGIRLGERLALDMVATPLLRTERMAVVAAPSYLSGKPPIESPADLLQHECIRFRLVCPIRSSVTPFGTCSALARLMARCSRSMRKKANNGTKPRL